MDAPDRPEWDDREHDELEMPFLDVVSQGGPYDDKSFVAGYQMGQIDGILSSNPNLLAATYLIYSELIDQFDLIAMRNGFTSDVLTNDGTWAQVGVKIMKTPDLLDGSNN